MDIYIILVGVLAIVLIVLLYLLLKQNTDLKNVEIQLAVLQTKYDEELKNSAQKLQTLHDAKETLSLEFKNLANKIFEDKSKQFTSTSKEQFELLLKPFREQITNFSKQSKEQFNDELKDRTLLKDELARLKQMNAQLSQDALNLTNALKGESKTQGNWGEIILERILEDSGLKEGREYELQVNLKSQEGKRYLPDVIVHLPEGRDIIIDSKVSLTAYERFVNEEDSFAKEVALKEHILSITKHIKELSAKKYDKLEGVNTLDFVLLFMPIEGAFLLALEQDGEFFKKAYESNILVVSPSTLLVTLRTIEHIWRTQHQQDNALKIADEAEAMYDKLSLFVDEFIKIGAQIDKTKESYDTALNRLNTGRGNIIKRAQNVVNLGVKTKKQIALKSEDEYED